VKDETWARQCAYVELVADVARKPQYLVDHRWKAPFESTVAALEWYVEAMGLSDSTVFWWDAFSINQHDVMEDAKYALDTLFVSVQQECRGVIICTPSGFGAWERAWLLFSVYCSTISGKDCCIGCTHGVLACNQPFPTGGWLLGSFDLDVAQEINAVKVEHSKTMVRSDLDMILPKIGGPDMIQEKFAQFNSRCARFVAGPLLRAAAVDNDCKAIAAICRRPGFRINSESLKGSLGETALHMAVRTKSMEAIKTLLEARMDPNVEDNIGERPLHYAALIGCAEAASALLSGGADPWAESAFGETTLQVALQFPTRFLKVDSNKLVAVLQKAQVAAPILGQTDIMDMLSDIVQEQQRQGDLITALLI